MDDPKPASSDKNEQDKSSGLLDQPYDDKQPETYVTPTGEPTTIAPIETPLSLQKPKGHSGRWLFRGFVVLLIAALAAFSYWQWTEAQSANNERASLQSELETVKSASKAAVEAENEDTVTTPSDKELVTTEVESYLAASENNKYELDEDTVEVKDTFATATAILPNSDAKGKLVVLKKAETLWVVLFSGTVGAIETTDKDYLVKEFGVPAAMLE